MYPYNRRGIGDPGIYPQFIGDPGIRPQAECFVAGCGPNANVGACGGGGPSYVGAPGDRGGGWRGGGGWHGGGRWGGWGGGFHPWYYASYGSYDPYADGYAGYGNNRGDGSQCVFDQRTGRWVCYVWDPTRGGWVIVG